MKLNLIVFTVLVSFSSAAQAAGIAGLLQSSGAMEKTNSSVDTADGKTIASEIPNRFSVSVGTGLSSPSLSAMSVTNPGSTYSLSNQISGSYRITSRVSIGPVLDFSNCLAGDQAGDFTFRDPQLRLSVRDAMTARVFGQDFRGMLLVSGYAPVSQRSRDMNSRGGVSVGLIPQMSLEGSRFSLAGIALAKMSLYERQDQSGYLFSGVGIGGPQLHYQMTGSADAFLMTYLFTTLGPEIPTPDAGMSGSMAAMHYRHVAQSGGQASAIATGLVAGTSFQVTEPISIGPQIIWDDSTPLSDASLGLNAQIKLL